jgi:hypothetical protein
MMPTQVSSLSTYALINVVHSMDVKANCLRNFIRENNLSYIACRIKYRENEFALDFIHLYGYPTVKT